MAAWLGCGSDVTTESPATNAAASTAGPASGTGGTTTSSVASVGGMASSGGMSMGGAGATMILDPATLEFFELPIGSLRYAVSGQDQASDTCVTLVWWGSFDPMCAMPGMRNWPYVIVTPGARAPCMQWDYGGNLTVDDASGCVEFTSTPPLTATVDVTVQVSGAAFTGTIIADNVP